MLHQVPCAENLTARRHRTSDHDMNDGEPFPVTAVSITHLFGESYKQTFLIFLGF